jgi:hypothetical protein
MVVDTAPHDPGRVRQRETVISARRVVVERIMMRHTQTNDDVTRLSDPQATLESGAQRGELSSSTVHITRYAIYKCSGDPLSVFHTVISGPLVAFQDEITVVN